MGFQGRFGGRPQKTLQGLHLFVLLPWDLSVRHTEPEADPTSSVAAPLRGAPRGPSGGEGVAALSLVLTTTPPATAIDPIIFPPFPRG